MSFHSSPGEHERQHLLDERLSHSPTQTVEGVGRTSTIVILVTDLLSPTGHIEDICGPLYV